MLVNSSKASGKIVAHQPVVQRRKPLTIALLCCFSFQAHANPTGAQVANGTVSINQSGSLLTVTNSPNAIINWQSFSIGSGETTRFIQQSASSSVLNRVTGADPSALLGTLTSNGRVFLINPAGVLVGQGANINVPGFVAATLNLSNSNFLAGKLNFDATPNAGSIQNNGSIVTPEGGTVYLIAPQVSNNGVINTPKGETILAAGNTVQLVDSGAPGVSVQVTGSNNTATNLGRILADSGRVGMVGAVVKNSGTLNANSLVSQGGKVFIRAGSRIEAGGTISAQGAIGGGNISVLADKQTGAVDVTGTLDASAPNSGNGGNIETSAATVTIADAAHVTTASAMGQAGTWLIDPVDFTIAATGGNITGSVLSNSLVAGAVTIASTSGTSGTAGNVNVNDVVSWSANKLTLNAQNNININANLNGSGTASLALEYGQGAIASGNTSTYNVNTAVNLPAGANFSTLLGSDGVVKNYTVITSLGAAGSVTTTDLQGIRGNLAGNYVLGSNIDASSTSSWNGGAGFTPIAVWQSTNFTGILDGLGHTISNLSITGGNGVGLFASQAGLVQNVGLVGGSVGGDVFVGELAGTNTGTINNSYATGSVSYIAGSGTHNHIGGLVGGSSGTISNSYMTGNVTANGASNIGGLVGWTSGGTISNCYATGNVNGTNSVGGLVGLNNSNSNGAGASGGTITNSYSIGSATGSSNIGGLVGYNFNGTVNNSFWDKTTSLNTTSAAGSGMTTAQMQQQTNFTSATLANGSVNPAWDFSNNWVMYNGYTYPLLRSFMTPLTVTANNATQTYNGQAYSGSGGVTYSVTTSTNLLGTLNYSGGTNAGTYTITPSGLYSNQQGYIISYANGTLTIKPATLSVSGLSGTNQTYNGTTVDALTGTATLGGLVGSESFTLLGTSSGTLVSKNAGSVAVSTSLSLGTASGGALTANYVLTQPTLAKVTIAPLALAGTITTGTSVYGSALAPGVASFTNAIAGDVLGTTTVAVNTSGLLDTGNHLIVGTHKGIETVSALGGADAGNYTFANVTGNYTVSQLLQVVAAPASSPSTVTQQPAAVQQVMGTIIPGATTISGRPPAASPSSLNALTGDARGAGLGGSATPSLPGFTGTTVGGTTGTFGGSDPSLATPEPPPYQVRTNANPTAPNSASSTETAGSETASGDKGNAGDKEKKHTDSANKDTENGKASNNGKPNAKPEKC